MDDERELLRRVWQAFGCAPNPEDFRPEVRARMWDMVVELAHENATQSGRLHRENRELRAELEAVRNPPISGSE